MDADPLHPDLRLALELADLADAISLARFRALDLRVDTKADLTPVTEVDTSVERALRERLAAARPRDAILGEEEGASGSEPRAHRRRWLLDPIDGTRNYARGIPVWFTLVALEEEGRVTVGVASGPALGRRWWARRGDGAYANGAPIRVSRVAAVEEAVVSYAASSRPFVDPILRRAWHPQPFSDAWAHLLVAEGSVDAAVEHELAPWDIAALVPIVEEAGGRCTDLTGAVRLEGGSLLTTNGLLHEELLAALGAPG